MAGIKKWYNLGMNEIRTAYFAGLIDGDGCIGFHRSGKNGARRLVVQVNMTHLETVQALHDYFGVGHVHPKKVYGNEKPQWRWKTTNSAAREVMVAIVPYLITKRDLTAELLKYSR